MMDYAAVRGHLSSRDITIPVDEWRTWETCDIFAPFPPPTNTADTAADTAAEDTACTTADTTADHPLKHLLVAHIPKAPRHSDPKDVVAAHGPIAVEKYGERFLWTHAHRTGSQLLPLRTRGDPLMDAALDRLRPRPREDVLTRLRESDDLADAALIEACASYPEWVDWDQVARGQEVYIQQFPLCATTLFYVSLVGGFSAPLITKVLLCTGYLTGPARGVMQRLMDTGHMISECCAWGVDAFTPHTGRAWEAVLRVRVLHAKVRRSLRRKDTWDGAAWGIPINQADLGATLLAFSYNVLVGVEKLRGSPLPAADQEAYIHLWRVVGWLLGIDDDCNPCRGGSRRRSCGADRGEDRGADRGEQGAGAGREAKGGGDGDSEGDGGGRGDGRGGYSGGVSLAKASLESYVMHLLDPDEGSVRVAHHLLRAPGEARKSVCTRKNQRGDRGKTRQAATSHDGSNGAGDGSGSDDDTNATNDTNDRSYLQTTGFRRRATMARAMLGDPLADALELPTDEASQRAIGWTLRVLRVWSWCSTAPLLGRVLSGFHRCVIRLVHRMGRRPQNGTFAMTHAPVAPGTGGRCPLGFGAERVLSGSASEDISGDEATGRGAEGGLEEECEGGGGKQGLWPAAVSSGLLVAVGVAGLATMCWLKKT